VSGAAAAAMAAPRRVDRRRHWLQQAINSPSSRVLDHLPPVHYSPAVGIAVAVWVGSIARAAVARRPGRWRWPYNWRRCSGAILPFGWLVTACASTYRAAGRSSQPCSSRQRRRRPHQHRLGGIQAAAAAAAAVAAGAQPAAMTSRLSWARHSGGRWRRQRGGG
jgi:hypothetical protein